MREGEVLWDRYRLKKRIGRGGMSQVYLAEEVFDGSLAALKWAAGLLGKEAVSREYECMRFLDHKGIPRVRGLFACPDGMVMVMDYVEGEDLKRRLDKEGSFSTEQVRIWGIALTCIVIYLHTQVPSVWHLDLKPSNLMVRRDGSLVLLDFGAAVRSGEVVRQPLGTKGYAAPEQQGGGSLSGASDIYSLGATLYHLWTGRIYEGEMGRHDSFLGPILERCLQENPGKRYSSGEELLRDLLDGRAGSRRRSLASLLKVSVVGVFCLGVWGIFGFLSLQRDMQEYQVQRELKETWDSENLCLLFPEHRDGYCLYLESAASDGLLDAQEEAGFIELCGMVPQGEEETCLALLRSDPEEYKAVAECAVENGMLYGSWEFAELFVEGDLWTLESALIRCREELMMGRPEDYSGYWKLLERWKEKEPAATLRILREGGLFFAGFLREGLREEVQKFWEEAGDYCETEEWKLLEQLFETLSQGGEDEGIDDVE